MGRKPNRGGVKPNKREWLKAKTKGGCRWLDDFKVHEEKAAELGFSLFVKRARIGQQKHIRVIPKFTEWSIGGTIAVWDDQITEEVLRVILEYSGRYKGLGDWRPGSKTPGAFGTFDVVVEKLDLHDHGAAWHGEAGPGWAWTGAARQGAKSRKHKGGHMNNGGNKSKGRVFLGKVSTDPEVNKLIDIFSPKPGEIIEHEQISKAINEQHGSPRYRSVVTAWRKKLFKKQNVDMAAESGIGYRILLEHEKISAGAKNARQGLKKVRKGLDRIQRADTEKLDEHSRRQQNVAMRLLGEMIEIGKRDMKKISISIKGPVALPKPVPPAG